MIFTKSILILEDNLKVVSRLLDSLSIVEEDQPYDFCVVVLTTSIMIDDYITNNPKAKFDIIILDRDCKLNGSFHTLDIERFGPEKIISISTVPEYNEEAQKRGVERIVQKDLKYLDNFAKKVADEVKMILTPSRLLKLRKI